jgi:hypothetical protein
MTSKYHDQMIHTVTKEINRVYKLFIERNPNFLENKGQVTLIAHSLGVCRLASLSSTGLPLLALVLACF